LEEEVAYLLSLITSQLAQKEQKDKKIKTFIEIKNLDRRLQLEADVIELQARLQEESSLWAKRKIDLAKLEDSLSKKQINDNFEGRIDRMKKKLKALKKLQKAYSKKGIEGSKPNSLGVNIYLIFGLLTLLLSVPNPNIKILTLMEKILNYFSSDPNGPYDN
jgi:predicted patatin/cPLA2 family phospholipase